MTRFVISRHRESHDLIQAFLREMHCLGACPRREDLCNSQGTTTMVGTSPPAPQQRCCYGCCLSREGPRATRCRQQRRRHCLPMHMFSAQTSRATSGHSAALSAAMRLCSPQDRLISRLRSRLASALQNAANEPVVALRAYTVLPDSQAEDPAPGSAEEIALAVRRCRDEAVAHERASIATERLNPRAAHGAGAAREMMGILQRGAFG